MITVRPAADPGEVAAAVELCWPEVAAGQAGFSLAGLASAHALQRAWCRLLEHPDDALLLAEANGRLVGACGLYVADPANVQTVNGPVAVEQHETVYDALLDHLLNRHPAAHVRVGLSHRHTRAIAWLERRGARLAEHAWPYAGIAAPRPPSPGVRTVREDEIERFAALFDELIGNDLWWTSARIRDDWGNWVCLVDDGWSAVLAARLFPDTTMSEVFAASAPDDGTATSLVGAWLSESVRRGHPEAFYFCESPRERSAAEAHGLACDDEYLSYLLEDDARGAGREG